MSYANDSLIASLELIEAMAKALTVDDKLKCIETFRLKVGAVDESTSGS